MYTLYLAIISSLKNSSSLGTAPAPGYKDTAALLGSVFRVEMY